MNRLLPPSAQPATRRPKLDQRGLDQRGPDRRRARGRDWAAQAGALSALVLAFVAAAASAAGVSGALALPAGAGAARGLAADPLALLFATLLLVGLAAGLCTRPGRDARLYLAARTAAGLLAVFAADPFTRALGVGLTALSWHAEPGRAEPGHAAPGRTASVAGVLCLVLGAAATGPAVSVALTLLGAGLLVGSAAPFAVELSVYLALRAVAGLASVSLPGAFAAWVMVAGVCLALAGAGAALASDRLDRTARRLAASTAGLVVVAVGVGLAARGRDLLPLTATSFGAALLLTVAAAIGRIGLTAASDLVAERAGSVVLFRLGGLSVRMKIVAAGIAASMVCALPLPPGPGFPGIWLLIQAAGALARTGGLGLPVLTVTVATGAALAIGLGAAASLRVLTVAVLGRPRTPRMAGAEDAMGDGRRAMVGVVAAAVLAGLLPALLLRALGPVVAVLSDVPTPEPLGLLALIPEADFQGYDAPLLAVLIALGTAVATMLVRRGATATEAPAEAPVWDGGLMPSPWLPYGEPGAQVAPSAVPRTIGWTLHLPPIAAWATERLARVRSGLTALVGDATPPRARSIRNGAGALLLVGIALLGALVLVLSR